MNLLDRWRTGLAGTRKRTFGQLAQIFGATEINADLWEQLEAQLLKADVGVETTESIVAQLRQVVADQGLTQAQELKLALREILLERLVPPELPLFETSPAVILLAGVNGSGKTTTAAKLGNLYRRQGRSVLLAAADTYRAAASEQLQAWGARAGIPVLAGLPGGDPGAVAFDAVKSAVARGIDIVLIDTAGRLHTRTNLMEELKKVHRVAGKALAGAPHSVWLVLDATTGQNALQQAKVFQEALRINGIVLTKLDSSARGGMVFAIQGTLGLPVLFVGLGEGLEDIDPFDPAGFVDSMLADV